MNSTSDADEDYDSTDMPSQLYLFIRLHTYLAPFVIFCGSVGNIAALLILLRPCFRTHSTSLYLSVFVAANTAYLYAGCGLEWLSVVAGLPLVPHLADWTCRLWKFLFDVLRHSLNWILVATVTDRLVATRRVLLPYRSTCRKRFVAKVAVVGVFVGVVSVAIHAMWTYGRVEETGDCDVDQVASIAWPLFSAFALSYIPEFILIVITPLLAFDFIRRRHNPSFSSDQTSEEDAMQASYTACSIWSASVFLVCSVPPNLLNVYWYANPPDVVAWQLSMVTCSMVTCFQSGMTFVWYFVCMTRLRLELAAALRQFTKCRNRETRNAIETRASEQRQQQQSTHIESISLTQARREKIWAPGQISHGPLSNI